MATTTNYGWTTPDDTALVKDGASAIRTLGTAIDTTTFNNAAAAIAKTIVDAKGDIIAATAADTVSRLAVGANDTVLTADSTAATGLKWATVASGGMTLISTTTLTGASVTLSSIPATYNHLYLVIRNYCPATDAIPMLGRFNADATANRHARATSITSNPSGFTETSFTAWGATQTNVSANCKQITVAWIPDYINTTTEKLYYSIGWGLDSDDTTRQQNSGLGLYNQTVAISSLSFFPQSGNFTSGTLLLYGVK